MEVLNYTIPPFKTMAWVSDEAREIWQHRFQKISEAVLLTTIESLATGKLKSQVLIVEGWMYFKIIEMAKPLNINISATFLGDENVKGPIYYEVRLLAKDVSESDISTDCCTECTDDIRTQTRKEHIWEAAIQTGIHKLETTEIQLPSEVDTSVFWQRMIATVGTQHRCNLNCKHAKQGLVENINSMIAYGYHQEAAWLQDVYQWPIAWNASHGICELRTPIIKLAYDTDATAIGYVVKIEGEKYPEEGAPGKRFPYRKRSFLRISDSKSFKAGLQHGS